MEGCLLAYSQAHPFLPGPKTGKTDDQDLNSVLSEKEVLHALWAVDKEMRKQVLEYLEEVENIMLWSWVRNAAAENQDNYQDMKFVETKMQ